MQEMCLDLTCARNVPNPFLAVKYFLSKKRAKFSMQEACQDYGSSAVVQYGTHSAGILPGVIRTVTTGR